MSVCLAVVSLQSSTAVSYPDGRGFGGGTILELGQQGVCGFDPHLMTLTISIPHMLALLHLRRLAAPHSEFIADTPQIKERSRNLELIYRYRAAVRVQLVQSDGAKLL